MTKQGNKLELPCSLGSFPGIFSLLRRRSTLQDLEQSVVLPGSTEIEQATVTEND